MWGPRPLWPDGFTEVRPLVHVNWSKINKQEFYHKTLKGLGMKKKLYRRNGHSITYMYISIVKENEDTNSDDLAILGNPLGMDQMNEGVR